MKTRMRIVFATVFCVSIGLNLAFVYKGFSLKTKPSSGAEITGVQSSAPGQVRGEKARAINQTLQDEPKLDRAFIEWYQSGKFDIETCVVKLRALGLPDYAIRSVVLSRSLLDFDRFSATQIAERDKEYWKARKKPVTGPQSEEVARMAKSRQEMMEKVDGLVSFKSFTEIALESARFGNLSPVSVLKIKKIEADYSAINGKYNENLPAGSRAADRGTVDANIEQEREQDLKAVLTPAEFREYELRSSRTARGLIAEFAEIDASEAEYVSLFDAKKAWNDEIRSRVEQGGKSSREGDYPLGLGSKYLEVLGPERGGAVLQKQDRTYRALLEIGGGHESAAKLYTKYHDTVNSALTSIYGSGSVSVNSALDQAEAEFRNSLPDETQRKLYDGKARSILRAQMEGAVLSASKR